jgi:hypothetical protein
MEDVGRKAEGERALAMIIILHPVVDARIIPRHPLLADGHQVLQSSSQIDHLGVLLLQILNDPTQTRIGMAKGTATQAQRLDLLTTGLMWIKFKVS